MRLNKLFIFLLLVPILASCSNDSFHYRENKEVTVVLIEDEHYHIVDHNQKKDELNSAVAYLNNVDSVNYTIDVDNNYYVSGVSYEDSQVFFVGNGRYSITLNNVKYSTRVTVFVEQINGDSDEGPGEIDESDNIITYDANGGEYILNNGLPMNKVVYSTTHHPRPNTSIGTDIMYRDGYNLIGWNTKSDLTGEHIGLGSRYLDLNNHEFTLYAEWSKYTNKDEFTYHIQDEHIVIDKFIGSSVKVSIPEYIDGAQVEVIGKSAFDGTNVETVIMPKSITNVGQLAFARSTLKEFYFFDNLIEISDGCFMECPELSIVHINAIMAPRYPKLDRNVTYADKVDHLIVNKGKKKLIILGGSGAFYNVDACVLKKLYPDYEPLNLAVNGWFNNYIQMDVVNRFIEDGDVFLHVVESCGKYQFMTLNDMGSMNDKNVYDARFFNCLELNYDLITYSDIRNAKHFFDVYASYSRARAKVTPKKYTDYTDYADERGDYTSDPTLRKNYDPRTIYSDDGNKTVLRESSITREGSVDRTCYNYAGMNILLRYYQKFIDKGVSIYFAFGCVAEQSILIEERTEENIQKYENEVKGYLSSKATIVNSMDDALISVHYFADSDWHLKYDKAVEETVKLANQMGTLNNG